MVNLKGKMRGQAAMEYLMTYGWALLVIVIVIAILLIINPFSAPQGCRFDDLGFSCGNLAVNQQGELYVTVTNNQNSGIKSINAYCTQDKSPNADPNKANPVAVGTVHRQGSFSIDPSTLSGVDSCVDVGSPPSGSGQEFSGKVWIFYQFDTDPVGYPYHTSSATFTTKVGV
ncbi:MAG: hypothetical protein NTV88_02720 [Candidatus Micrarchaeota archaeon]|nr:hypothetical protein [Candidatus Micrarchaeota archaeon]